MAAIVAENIFKCIFLNENDKIPIITWNNADTVHWRIYAAAGGMIEANPFEIRNSLVRNSSGDIVKLWSPYSIWRQHDPFTQLKDES